MKSIQQLLEIAGIKDIDKAMSILEEGASGYITPDDELLKLIQHQLIGQVLMKVSMVDPSTHATIDKVTKSNMGDDNMYLLHFKNINDWHPLQSHKEFREALLKRIGKWIALKGVKVAYESQNWQNKGLLGLNIDVKAQYKNNFTGGLLQHVKNGNLVFIDGKANDNLKRAAQIVNKFVMSKNTNILTCQQELIENDLEEFAEL